MKTIEAGINTDIINEKSIPGFREAFATAKPYKHLVIDDFLKPELAAALFENFPKVTELRKHYKGLNENKSEGSSFEDYHEGFGEVLKGIRSEGFIEWLEKVTQIDHLSLPEDHRGAGVHQGKNGSFLDIHVDFSVHPILNLHRRLNLLIFLNKNWKPEYGGLLELWNEDVTVLEKEILPAYNRAVIFETTSTSYHGYDVINIPEEESRKSIYSYYYSPVGKGVKYHDTIFKPRPSDSAAKKIKTNTKETLKNTLKKTLKAIGLKGLFEKYE